MTHRPSHRDIVVPCSTGKHSVRLGRGTRFWRPARCPVCRTPVDPSRSRRLLRWLANHRRPATGWWLHRVVRWGSLGFFAFVVATAGSLWGLSDLWWPATVFLFGPRWVLLLPLPVLLVLALVWDRQFVALLVLTGLIVLGPVMGFRIGWRSLVPTGGNEPPLEVATFNARGGDTLLRSPMNLLMDWNADIVAFQECSGELAAGLRQIPSWHVDTRSGVCLASRFPIAAVAEMERKSLESAGGSGVVVTYSLDFGGRLVYVTNIHLETPRAGFELVRSGQLDRGIVKVSEKSFLRGVELKRAAIWAEEIDGPRIVLGDFNTPPESRLFRRAWGAWQNTFSLAGWGTGGTRLNGWIKPRIDHILADGDWRVLQAWVGDDAGSDHLPVFARIRLR